VGLLPFRVLQLSWCVRRQIWSTLNDFEKHRLREKFFQDFAIFCVGNHNPFEAGILGYRGFVPAEEIVPVLSACRDIG
jgi:hypothetical protein